MGREPRHGPWLICATSGAITVVGLVLFLQNRRVPGTDQFFDPIMPAVGLAFPPMGMLINSRWPRHPIGWLWLATGLVAVAFAAEQYAVHALITDPGSLPGGLWMAWLGSFVWVPGYFPLWTLVPLLFPDGRPPSRRWLPLVWVVIVLIAIATVATALASSSVGSPSARNPLGIESFPNIAGPAQALAILVLGPLCLGALLVRYREVPPPHRLQMTWVVLAAAATVLVPVSAALGALLVGTAVPLDAYRAAGLVALLAVPGATLFAVVRHRLYDIAVDGGAAINRLVLYGGLTAVAALAFLAIARAVEVLGSGRIGLGASMLAVMGAGVVSYVVRRPLQQRVDRLLYRKRHYDYRVFSALSQSVQSSVGPDAVLPGIVHAIAVGLKLPHVAIDVGQGDDVIASAAYGHRDHEVLVLRLLHQNEAVGRLTVAPRGVQQRFDAADRRLLEDLGRQVGVVAYALCLTADLQRARERLVTAREEERRRLRRDLHDGLKPALAGVSLGLAAVRNSLGADNPSDDLLRRLKDELDSAAGDIRRLVYDLRPPALDDLGLVGALRQHASSFGLGPGGMEVVVDAPPEVNALPAAVEVAAYRIGVEALENVRKHAGARRCELVLAVANGNLALEVRDDGRGLDARRGLGVGLLAMRERAAELGGTCSVESDCDTGTVVRAVLPIAGR